MSEPTGKNTDTLPLITIVTVVYNDAGHLESTIRSVLEQSYPNIEYIIIDGGSTDGTLDIIRKYDAEIDCWVSERDRGIYDAMNKGARLASGSFLNFLNSGDTIDSPSSLETVVRAMKEKEQVYFTRASVIGESASWLYPAEDVTDIRQWLRWNLPNHQSIFFPYDFYKNCLYDLRLRLTADDDCKRYALREYEGRFIDTVYVRFVRTGVSSDHADFSLFRQRLREAWIRNAKHGRWFRLFLDPLKLSLMFVVSVLFGRKGFDKFLDKGLYYKNLLTGAGKR